MADFRISEDGKILEECTFYRDAVIVVPEGIEVIGRYCFYPKAISYQWDLKEVVLPQSIKRIEDHAFCSNQNLYKINIPDSIEFIGPYAFEGCRSLENITLPQTCEKLEKGTLCDCLSLRSLIIPPSVRKFEELLCAGIGVKDIYIPEGVTELDDSCFFCCKDLESIYLPSTLTTIKPYAFRECDKLKKIIINPNSKYLINDNGVIYDFEKTKVICNTPASNQLNITLLPSTKTICCSAFWNSKIHSINLPYGLRAIEANVFHGCKNLKFIYIPDTVTYFEYGCFAYCGIEYFRLPSNILAIPKSIFKYNPLKSVEIPEGVNIIEDDAFCGSNIESLIIPSSVKIIGKCAFMRCKLLKEITISEGVEIISEEAFSECKSLRQIIIPASVTEITGQNTFSLCPNLRKIICYANGNRCEMLRGMSSFFYSDRYVTLYVPNKYLDNYIEHGFSTLFYKVIGF